VVINFSHHEVSNWMTKGFIRYEIKNGIEYASVYKARRIDGKKTNEVEHLGRVIDKEQGIYRSRARGVFTFSLDDGYASSSANIELPVKERLILDFGDAYLLNEILKISGLLPIFKEILSDNADTLLVMLAHRILDTCGANRYAQEWWEGSYARLLYPKAALRSQRLSEFLCTIGEESIQRRFFNTYLKYITAKGNRRGILVDSTGLPNDIHFPLTAVNTHNGVVSNETRLILVVDRYTHMPIYFRYAAGNIVDVTTLKTTLKELAEFGVDVNYAIVDAGYYSESNIREMQEAGIAFVVRLIPNRKLYKELVAAHANDIEDARNMVCYRQRLVFIKQVPVNLFGKEGYAYVAIDIDRKHDEIRKYAKATLSNKDVSADEMNRIMRSKGLFIILSAQNVDIHDILPLYYERQAIEQVFDLSKNNTELLPLRVHSEETFRGHLLLSFLAATVYIAANNLLDGSDNCAMSAFHLFRNLKCKVFKKQVIVLEPNKKMNDIAKHLKLSLPSSLPLW